MTELSITLVILAVVAVCVAIVGWLTAYAHPALRGNPTKLIPLLLTVDAMLAVLMAVAVTSHPHAVVDPQQDTVDATLFVRVARAVATGLSLASVTLSVAIAASAVQVVRYPFASSGLSWRRHRLLLTTAVLVILATSAYAAIARGYPGSPTADGIDNATAATLTWLSRDIVLPHPLVAFAILSTVLFLYSAALVLLALAIIPSLATRAGHHLSSSPPPPQPAPVGPDRRVLLVRSALFTVTACYYWFPAWLEAATSLTVEPATWISPPLLVALQAWHAVTPAAAVIANGALWVSQRLVRLELARRLRRTRAWLYGHSRGASEGRRRGRGVTTAEPLLAGARDDGACGSEDEGRRPSVVPSALVATMAIPSSGSLGIQPAGSRSSELVEWSTDPPGERRADPTPTPIPVDTVLRTAVLTALLRAIRHWSKREAAQPSPATTRPPTPPRADPTSPFLVTIVNGIRCWVEEVTPTVTGRIRRAAGIAAADVAHSLAGERHADGAWSGVLSEGRSGAFMWRSADERFVLKSLTAQEVATFRRIAADYADYLETAGDRSLLVRFLGLYRVRWSAAAPPLSMVLMLNLVPGTPEARFDLKGSWIHRGGQPGSRDSLGLDLDLTTSVGLHPVGQRRLLSCLARDTAFLADHNLMDYSLLLARLPDSSRHTTHVNLTQGTIRTSPTGIHLLLDTSNAPWSAAILDILQPYNLAKKLERVAKTYGNCADADGLSVVPPHDYAIRLVSRVSIVVDDGVANRGVSWRRSSRATPTVSVSSSPTAAGGRSRRSAERGAIASSIGAGGDDDTDDRPSTPQQYERYLHLQTDADET